LRDDRLFGFRQHVKRAGKDEQDEEEDDADDGAKRISHREIS
jgi:hypothetical protein